MKKINIIYDSTMLIHNFSKSHDRSGVFFVVYNVLKEISENMRFKIYLYIPQELFYTVPAIKQDKFLRKFVFFTIPMVQSGQGSAIHKLNMKRGSDIALPALSVIKNYWQLFCRIFNYPEYKRILKHANIFFSTFHAIPYIIKNYSHIKTYMILYDTMPLNFSFYYPDINVNDINDWYGKILAGLNKETYYFCISECTKNDF
ncbi:MAG: hypothetical protein LBE13_14440, partial [Bacteroidales bacterium]|nr:hypothetical protein [Bacteroidales bacterium]